MSVCVCVCVWGGGGGGGCWQSKSTQMISAPEPKMFISCINLILFISLDSAMKDLS